MAGAQSFNGSPGGVSYVRINNGGVAGDAAGTVVTAVTGKTVRVYGMRLSVAAATVVSIKDAVSGNVLEVFNFAGAGGAAVFDLREIPFYVGAVSGAFVVSSSAAVQVDGRLEYTQGI